MTNLPARCELCGEPMPPGEAMFKFHGFSGPCPKPPLQRDAVKVVIEYRHRDEGDKFWLDVLCAGQVWDCLAFDSAEQRRVAQDDLLAMMRSLGATHPNRG